MSALQSEQCGKAHLIARSLPLTLPLSNATDLAHHDLGFPGPGLHWQLRRQTIFQQCPFASILFGGVPSADRAPPNMLSQPGSQSPFPSQMVKVQPGRGQQHSGPGLWFASITSGTWSWFGTPPSPEGQAASSSRQGHLHENSTSISKLSQNEGHSNHHPKYLNHAVQEQGQGRQYSSNSNDDWSFGSSRTPAHGQGTDRGTAAGREKGGVLGRGGSTVGGREEEKEESDILSTDPILDEHACLNKREVGVFCSVCRFKTEFDSPASLIECGCCHRVFHRRCYNQQHSKVENITAPLEGDVMDTEQRWFHSKGCIKVDEKLRSLAARGEQAILSTGSTQKAGASGAGKSVPEASLGVAASEEGSPPSPSHSWRLLLCRNGRSPAARVAMSQAYSFLSRDFGYTLGDYNSFDAAAILKQNGIPACAAVLDVYGEDAAEIFVIATRGALRRQGNCRRLMQQVALAMSGAGIRRLVVSVDEDDQESQQIWDRLGFQPLQAPTLRSLRWGLPAFSQEGTAGTTYLCQELVKGKGLMA